MLLRGAGMHPLDWCESSPVSVDSVVLETSLVTDAAPGNQPAVSAALASSSWQQQPPQFEPGHVYQTGLATDSALLMTTTQSGNQYTMATSFGSSYMFPSPLTAHSQSHIYQGVVTSHATTSHSAAIQFPTPVASYMSTGVTSSVLNMHNHDAASTAVTNWKHTVPSMIQWGNNHSSPSAFQFTGSTAGSGQGSSSAVVSSGSHAVNTVWSNNTATYSSVPYRPIKRRSDDKETLESPVRKVFINEERMASRLQGLQLDNNNYSWQPNMEESWYSHRQPACFNQPVAQSKRIEDEELDEADRVQKEVRDGLPRLLLDRELELSLKSKDLFAKTVLEEMTKPCMEIVLWKPPGEEVRNLIKNISDTDEEVKLGQNRPPTPNSSMRDILSGRHNNLLPRPSALPPNGMLDDMMMDIPRGGASNGLANGQLELIDSDIVDLQELNNNTDLIRPPPINGMTRMMPGAVPQMMPPGFSMALDSLDDDDMDL